MSRLESEQMNEWSWEKAHTTHLKHNNITLYINWPTNARTKKQMEWLRPLPQGRIPPQTPHSVKQSWKFWNDWNCLIMLRNAKICTIKMYYPWKCFQIFYLTTGSTIFGTLKMRKMWFFCTLKVLVVKWCRRKWNDHNLMYIYHIEFQNMPKIQWNSWKDHT